MIKYGLLLRGFAFIALVVFAFVSQAVPVIYALSPDQKEILDRKIYYYDVGCSADPASTTPSAGSGEPDGAIFPKLPPDAMAKAIDKYIEQTNASSKLNGLGETIVAGAKNSNVSPFLIVAIAQKESSLASPSDFNVRNGNNAFGRSATSSQPNFQGRIPWYKWTSVKASVDHTASENKDAAGGGDIAAYIRKQYPQQLDNGDIAGFFKKYAPEFENDTEKYIRDVGNGITKMVALTNQQSGGLGSGVDAGTEEPSVTTTGSGCTCGAADDSPKDESGKEATIFKHFVDAGYTPEQAAGFVGNFYQESKYDPTVVNGIGATGIAQWLGSRKTDLFEFAKGRNPKTLTVQLEFAVHELKGKESAANTAIKAVTGSGPDAVERVTPVIRVKYERPGEAEANDPARIERALIVYEKNGGAASTPATIGDPTTGGGCGGGGTGTGESTGQFDWPLGKSAPVTTCYGYGRGRLHTGLDIAAPTGTKLLAADGGTVELARNTDPGGYGKVVIIKHSNGKWTLYGHMNQVTVNGGDKVDKGQGIGEVGNTGSSRGAHVHFNIMTSGSEGAGAGETIDPLKLLPNDGRAKSGTDC